MRNIILFLQILNFSPLNGEDNVWSKTYQSQYQIRIELDKDNLKNSKIDWGNKITVGRNTTSNFSQEETFVVLECVNRLLEKGYKPENIILEKSWQLGHKGKGFLDILVLDEQGKSFLMVECKTWGKEYQKEKVNTEKDGGQLLSYVWQEKSTKFVCLYSSIFDGNKIDFQTDIIVISEFIKQGQNQQEVFEAWNPQVWESKGIFGSLDKPYQIKFEGLKKNDLKDLTANDGGDIFNRFAEILRRNVVSDKTNAFNKIFNLFLCKIVDEFETPDEEKLNFQWQESENNETVLLRLNDLYKRGMELYLNLKIEAVSEDELKQELENSQNEEKIKQLFIRQKLYSGNEFAFKEVFDKDSFNENAVVVKEIVKLIEKYKIKYSTKQQFLGDFFENLLNTGIKQESGQFFTPIPIAQFICKSLPIKQIIEDKNNAKDYNILPYFIDYASGSGHFLTEYMEEVDGIIKDFDENKIKAGERVRRDFVNNRYNFNWAKEYVYGIEKDYRLAKTTKISTFLNGDGDANIICGDGLDAFDSKNYQGKLKEKDEYGENRQFDVLIANPPYSVSGFKTTLENSKESFELYKDLTDKSSEIEVLFIERTKQLLKDGGIAAIILPSSILSNTGLYTKTREILLKYFKFISIVELGNNTFMATGTNTVILFLKRRNNYEWQIVQSHIQKAFDTKQDLTINEVEKLISKYLKTTEEKLSLAEYLEKYTDDNLEKQKLLYFALAYPQKIVLVKTGEKDEEKKFLGYYFSNRRGHEGIKPFVAGQTISECTYLYDENNPNNTKKANYYIQKAFTGDFNFEIDPELNKNVSVVCLADLLDFESKKFEKIINTRSKKKLKIESKWEVVKLGEVCDETINGGTPSKDNPEYWNSKDVKWLTTPDFKDDELFLSETSQFVSQKAVDENKTKIVPKNSVLLTCTATIGKVCINKVELTTNQQINGIICNSTILPQYLAYYLKTKKEDLENLTNNSGVKHINLTMLKNFPVVLPPLNIQTQIVTEIEQVESEGQKAKTEIEKLQNEISELVANAGGEEMKLGDVADTQYGWTDKAQSVGEVRYLRITDIDENSKIKLTDKKFISPSEELKKQYLLQNNDIVIARSGSIGKATIYKHGFEPMIFASYLIRLKIDEAKALPDFIFQFTQTKAYWDQVFEKQTVGNQPNLNAEKIKTFNLYLPPLVTQQKIVAQIQEIEKKIEISQVFLDSVKRQKEAVLKRFL
jgi:type I restriction enzyme M protein